MKGERGEAAMVEDTFVRGWDDLIARDDGPLQFRLILQPTVAVLLAIRAGWRDAREGRPLYFWTVVGNATQRRLLLRQGWRDVGKLFLVAIVLDVIYQILVMHWLYPGEALIVAMVLAIIPYLVVRGLANRIGSHLRPGTRRK
jgi:hypothetical protein